MKTGFKKVMGIFSLVLALCMLFTACAPSAPDADGKTDDVQQGQDPQDTQTGSGVGLTGDFEVQIVTDGFGEQIWTDALDGFQAENPDLNIIVNSGATVNEQMNTRWMGDDPPDFVYLSGGNLPVDQFIADGKLMDLTEWFETATDKITGEPIKDKLIDGMLCPENGKLYRAPLFFSTWGVWYDEALFEENQIEVPTNYDELMEAGAKFQEKGIPLFCYTGVYANYLTRGFLQPAMGADYGEEFLNKVASGEDPEVYRSEEFKAILTKYKSMVDAGYVMDGTVALDHTGSQMAWLNHEAALIPNGLWLENEMKQDIPEGFRMRFVASVLQDASSPMTINPQGTSVAIAADAKNPEAALAFLEYLYRDANMENFVALTGNPASVKMDASNLDISEVAKDVISKISDPSINSFPQNPINLPADVEKAFTDAMNAITLGGITVEEACERIYEAAVNMES